MAIMRRAGRGLRAGRIVRRFDEAVIAGQRECIVLLQDNILAKRVETGVSAVNPAIAFSILPTAGGVELAGKCSSPQPLRRGLGGRGWQECVEPDEGYAPVVTSDDSARL